MTKAHESSSTDEAAPHKKKVRSGGPAHTFGPSAVVQRARRGRVYRDHPHHHVGQGCQARHRQHADGVEAACDLEGQRRRREMPAHKILRGNAPNKQGSATVVVQQKQTEHSKDHGE